MMSAEKIRKALGLLLDDPDNEAALQDVEELATSDGGAEVVRELEMGRMRHEQLQNWPVVARLLELEITLDDEMDIATAKQLELARIYHEELLREGDAEGAYKRALEMRPDEAKAMEAIGEIEFGRANLESTIEHALVEALDSEDPEVQEALYVRAAEVAFRYGTRDEAGLERVGEYLKQALGVSPESHRGLALAVLLYSVVGDQTKLADALFARASSAPVKEDRVASAHRLCDLLRTKLEDDPRIVDAHQLLIDLDPSHQAAMAFLVEHYSTNEEWDHLVALYEDQLGSGAMTQSEELGAWVQIAMINWKTREKAADAEPYFEKVRRVEPTHAGMLQFFRDRCGESGDSARLMAILTDAQRALEDGDSKTALLEEIAELAEGQENARQAIEQYKTILRTDPDNEEARDKLKALYLETESYNALVELYRQDLNRVDQEDTAARIAILRQVAEIYSDRMESDTALLTVLTQILQLDDTDIAAVRGLIKVYESLGRWRDLLNTQQRLAELTDNQTEKVNLLRAVARRWLDQFSNVQNAIAAHEALLEATGDDVEAREKLRELYKKRRAWPKLYELYETQVEGMEGDQRIELMQEMAKLAAERLDRGEEAIRLLKEVLVFDPSAEGVLDQLERLAERQKDYPTVAHVLERRIESCDDDKTKIQLLQKLGVLSLDKLEDAEASNKAWRRVLDLSPGHKRALRVLRQSYVTSGDWDGLAELYESQDDHEGLADFLSTTADRSKEEQEKVELSFRAASVYEDQLGAPERAARSYERVLTIDESNVRAAQALLPLYQDDEKWSRLPGLYAILLEATEDVEEKIEILHKVADITGGPLANKAGALGYARQAYELRPDEEGLKSLEEWSQQSGEWSAFIEVVHERLEAAEGSDSRELQLMLAKVNAQEVEKLDEAVKIYRSLLESDPSDTETAQILEELLRAADRRDDLRWLFELKVDRFEGDERSLALEDWATVEEEVFGEPERAVELLRRIVEDNPQRVTALTSLTRLLLTAEDFAGAVEVITTHRDATEGEDRLQLETQLAELHLEHLDAPVGAYEACVRGLEIEEDYPPLVELLEHLMEPATTRPRAARTLERIYASTGAGEAQAGALRALLESEEDLAERLTLCQRLAVVHERDLDDAGGAFDVILSALREAPAEVALWDRAEELCGTAGRPTDLAEAYRLHLTLPKEDGQVDGEPADSMPDELRLDLCERAAVLHEDQLGDVEGAVPYLEQMLTIEPRNSRAFDRLKAILNAVERWSDLEGLFQRTIAVTEEEGAKTELLHQAALVSEEMIGDNDKAIGYFEAILEIDSLHEPATDALERLYGREERFQELAALLERRLETTPDDDAAEIQQQLIELYLRQLSQHDRVMGHLENLLHARTDDLDARRLAEECLEVPSLRQPAAALLDDVYVSVDDPRDLVRILDVRLEGAETEEDKRALLHRIGTLRDDRLKDDGGAFEALRALMPLEPDDAEIRGRLIEVGRRLGENAKMAEALLETAEKCSTPVVRGEILMEAAQLYRDRLDELERAESTYRQVLEIDPDDPDLVIPAAQALAEIYQEESEHQKLAEVIAIHVRLVTDPEESRELYARIANLYEDLLENDGKAVEAWQARLAEDSGDVTALQALERLYERTEQWADLVGVMRSLEDVAEDGDKRKRCMVKAAEVLDHELAETADAINAWRAVLDDFGPEPEILAALAKLYEKAERWEDLGEVYDVWLSLTEELDEQVELHAGLGNVRRAHLDDPQGALMSYREVLTLQPSHQEVRASLEQMLEHEDPDIKREAAEIIGPLYEADGDSERLLKVLDIEVESTYDPIRKLETLERALATAEDTVGSGERAFGYACRGVREAIGEPALREWIETLERLAAETERWTELMELYESVVGEMLDAEIQQQTRLRAGELARDRLEDEDRAIGHFTSALEAQADDERAMIALEELYESTKDNEALLEILQLRAEAAETDDDRTELLFRVAELQAGPLEDSDAAIRTYEEIIDLGLQDRAVDALEGLYTKAERYDDLIRLHERQLDEASDELAADVRVKIAKAAHGHTDDTQRALDELGEALGVDPEHQEAIALLENLLEELEELDQRGQVAELLEPVYLNSHDWSKLRLALEARLECTQDPDDRSEYLHRLATLYEEQLEDYSSALDAVAMQLRDEPTDEAIWGEVERLGRVLGADAELRVAEIFASALDDVGADSPETASLCARTGELFAAVDKNEEALKWYGRGYEFSPDSTELFEAIDGLLVKLMRHEARVEHYRGGLDQTFDDDVRVKYLHVIAELQQEKLSQDDEAVSTLCELLDIEETNEAALDKLTELYKRNKRLDDLAELYERRADLSEGAEQAAPYRLELSKLLAADESSRDRALDQLDIIVSDMPWHEGAIGELEEMLADEDRKQRVIDLLRPLYKHADNWEGLILLNDERLGLADIPADQVDIMMDSAALWEDQGDDLGKAFEVTRLAFGLMPDNEEVRGTMERLAESLEAWRELAASYDEAAESVDDDFVKRQLLSALASVCDDRLDDPRRALVALANLSELDPTDGDTLERMDILTMLLSDWPMLVTVLERMAENAMADDDRASVLRRLGELKRDMLDDQDGAMKAYEEALELEPESLMSLDQLIGLYEERDASRLVELLEQRIEYTDPDDEEERHGLMVQAAQVYETKLEDKGEAIRMLQMALDLRPTDGTVLKALEGLYLAEEQYDALLDNLKTQASTAEEAEARLELRNKIGDLFLSQFDNAFDGLEQYRLVLEENDTDEHAISSARKIGENYDDLRLEVSALLEPVLTAAERHGELVEVMELRFAAQTDPVERAQTLRAKALIQEEQLDDEAGARDTLLRALKESPEDSSLHDDINRFCDLTGDFSKYADALQEQAEAVYDAIVQADLYSRLGQIAEEQLKETERAIEAYNKASELSETPETLYEALDRLYVATDNSTELGRVLERRAEIAGEGPDQADLYYRLGKLQIEAFEDNNEGLSTLRMAADQDPEHKGICEELEKLTDIEELFEEVSEVLDTMYRVTGDSAARAKLRNKRISYAPTAADRIRLRLELAQMLEDESFDTHSAQEVIQQAIFDDPSDAELLAQLERLATTNAGVDEGDNAWRRAADGVGAAVAKALAAEAAGEGEGNVTSELARDLYLRTAGWYREHAGDDDAAEKRLNEALEQDGQCAEALVALEDIHRTPGREKALVDTLRKLAELAQVPETNMERTPAELRREAKVLAESELEDLELAEQILRDMLQADDSDDWALTELCTVCERNEDFRELYTLLQRRIELMPEADEMRDLRHQAAKVAADKLDDTEAAIDLYEQAFEEDSGDRDASDALRELYQKLERYEDMLRLTERLMDHSEEPEERAKLRLESAKICIEILEAPTEGIEHLNAVLEEVPGHAGAVELLASMLEKEERDDELAELLNTQIELAKEQGDQDKELGFRVKSAELYESRLNDAERAIEGYLAVLEVDNGFRPALVALARLYEQEDETAKAAEASEKLLDGAEVDELTRLALKARDLYVAVDDKEAGCRVLETVLDSDVDLGQDEVAQLRDGLKALYRDSGAWDKLADLITTEAGESEDDNEKVVKYRKAAEIHAGEREDHAAAAELLEKALELQSDDRDLMLSLCDEYTKSGRGKDAIDVLNRVVESYGGRRSKELADIHQRIATAHLADGDNDAALKELESARKMDPGAITILQDLGTLSISMFDDTDDEGVQAEHLKRAGNAFRSLLLQRLDADSPVTKAQVFYLLSQVSKREGDTKKAIQMAERAVSNDKEYEEAKTLLEELKG